MHSSVQDQQKQNMATRNEMQTRAGSWAVLGSIVPSVVRVVSGMRDAGAVNLGYLNMSECADLLEEIFLRRFFTRWPSSQCI